MRKRGETVGKTPLVDHILQERFIGDRKECTDHEGKTGKKREPGWFWLGEGLGRGRGLGRLLIKSFRLKVWAEEAVKSRPMLCPDVLSVLMGSLAGRKGCLQPALCHRLSLFVALLKLLQSTCRHGAVPASSRATY